MLACRNVTERSLRGDGEKRRAERWGDEKRRLREIRSPSLTDQSCRNAPLEIREKRGEEERRENGDGETWGQWY